MRPFWSHLSGEPPTVEGGSQRGAVALLANCGDDEDMVAATVITYSQEAPSDKHDARNLAGPIMPTLAQLWVDTYGKLPETYYFLVHAEGAYEHGHSGPVRRLNPPAFARGSGSVPVACTITDDPEAEHSRFCIWKLGGSVDPAPST